MLQDLVDHIVTGQVPGAVALVARGADVEIAAAGVATAQGSPMRRDTIVRASSAGKPLIGALAMSLVDDGTLTVDDPVDSWLPELADIAVLRAPGSQLDDTVPLQRPITVDDLLTLRSGHGFPTDFSLPVVEALTSQLRQGSMDPREVPAPDEWMRRLARIPLLHQPGAGWTYNVGTDILGVLLARAAGTPLPELLRQRILEPLAMTDTAFHVPADKLDRFADFWRRGDDGHAVVAERAAEGRWVQPPPFPSGAGGLVTTLDDWARFGRMLLAGGTVDGHVVLEGRSVTEMTTDHLTEQQRQVGDLFLDGQGWGYCGSVDRDGPDVWNQAGRFGWVGGTGTSAHVVRSSGLLAVLMTQFEMTGPETLPILEEFWAYAAQR